MDKITTRECEAAIERGHSDPATGEFAAILATEGEASDGHILSIRGLDVPDEMPLLAGHQSPLTAPVMGRIFSPKKSYGAIPMLRVKPRINLNGEGVMTEIRQGTFQLIHDGDLTGMSLRWETTSSTRRVNLPRDHHAFVDAAKVDGPARGGYFISKSGGKEGSVVGLGADGAAMIGRSQDAKSEGARVFWRALARSIESGTRSDGMGEIATAFATLQESLAGMRSLGIEDTELAALLAGDMTPGDMIQHTFTGEDGSPCSVHLPRSAWESLRGESLREYQSAISLRAEAEALRQEDGGGSTELAEDLEDETSRDDPGEEIKTRAPESSLSKADLMAAIARQNAEIAKEVTSQVLYHVTGRLPQ